MQKKAEPKTQVKNRTWGTLRASILLRNLLKWYPFDNYFRGQTKETAAGGRSELQR